ncbi:MAG: cupin domain-containing protein [Actinomycetota bacterium]|nr:cupin domain-containing protein [Actinomycetota bacterium]
MTVQGRLGVGEAIEDWSGDARFFEYSQAADPVGDGVISPVPAVSFGSDLYASGPTRAVALDLSVELRTPYPATTPALLASFLRINAGDELDLHPNATSQLLYCIRGRGHSRVDGAAIPWKEGDFVTLPATTPAVHVAEEDSALYHVVDTPLLDYLGARATSARFRPTAFTAEAVREKLAEVASAPDADRKSRVSVLLNNRRFDQTLTATHTLWAMFGVLPAGRTQLPHRHQSVAVDLIVDCPPGCYSLLGDRVDAETGGIVDPVRVDWESGGAFVTPPGTWHSHHNESGRDAHLIPIQDAGLHTYLRTLDIRFSTRD